jgi:hypothetical protein
MSSRNASPDVREIEIPSGGTTSSAEETHTISSLQSSPSVANISSTPSSLSAASPPLCSFQPSRILFNGEPTIAPELEERAAELGLQQDRTSKYKGDITAFDLDNISVTEGENHAIHLMNIHPDASFADIFTVFNGVKIFSFNRQAPIENEQPNAAGNLVLMTRAMAKSLMAQIKSDRGLVIKGMRISAVWNRHRVGTAALARFQKMSRVVCIKGPREAFEKQALIGFFEKNFKFDLVSSREWNIEDGKKVAEFEFSCIRAQAENAMLVFREQLVESAEQPDEFKVWYLNDPCEVERYRPPQAQGAGSAGWRSKGSWRRR